MSKYHRGITMTPKTTTYDTPFGRIYKIGNRYYTSVTTIQSGFKPNKTAFHSDYAAIGTRAHYEIFGLYRDMESPKSSYQYFSTQDINSRLDSILSMWEQIHLDSVIDVEFVVSNNDYEFAGRGDIIAEKDGEIVLGDVKTGNYYKHYDVQIGAYYLAAKRKYKIDKGALFMLDCNVERNPSQAARIIWFTKDELISNAKKFVAKAIKYNADRDRYLEIQGRIQPTNVLCNSV